MHRCLATTRTFIPHRQRWCYAHCWLLATLHQSSPLPLGTNTMCCPSPCTAASPAAGSQAVLERCGHELPPLHRLITMGAQHQGVMNVPGCR
jgi:hypothetical protein